MHNAPVAIRQVSTMRARRMSVGPFYRRELVGYYETHNSTCKILSAGLTRRGKKHLSSLVPSSLSLFLSSFHLLGLIFLISRSFFARGNSSRKHNKISVEKTAGGATDTEWNFLVSSSIPSARSQLEIMIYSAASARRCSAGVGRGEDAPSRGLIGGSEGRNLDVKTPRDIERTCPPVYGSTYDTCRYSTPSVFSNRNPLPPIYCERAVPSLPCPQFTPSRGPAMQISFSPRASVLYGASLLSRFRTLPPLCGRPLFPPIVPSSPSSPAPCRSFAATILSYVWSPPSLSRSLPLSFLPVHFVLSLSLSFPPPSLTIAHPLRLPHFHCAHPLPPPFSTRQHRRHRHRRGQYNRRHATLPSRRRSPRTGSLFVIVAYSIYCLRRFARRRGCPGGVGRY